METPATLVQDYFVQLRKGSRNQVSGWVRLNGEKLNQRVTVRIPEAGISKSFTTDANGYAETSFNTDLTLWSPNNPKLYDVIIEAETDRIDRRRSTPLQFDGEGRKRLERYGPRDRKDLILASRSPSAR